MNEPKPLQDLLAQLEPPTPDARPSPSTTSDAVLPQSWVERIFDVMAANYGARFADAWRGANPTAVKEVWARKLGTLTPAQIRSGMEHLDQCRFPPTLPEFVALCRQGLPQAHVPRLAAPGPTPEQRAAGRQRFAEIRRRLGWPTT